MAGQSQSTASAEDMWAVKTNSVGETLWTRGYGLSAELDQARAVAELPDHGFAIAGFIGSGSGTDLYMVRTDSCGDIRWSYMLGLSGSSGASVAATSDGGYAVAGTMQSPASRMLLVRFAADPSSVESEPHALAEDFALSASPNPFNPTTTISFTAPRDGRVKLSVFDLLGREVKMLSDEIMTAGAHRILFNGSDLPSGIYFARLQSGDYTAAKKLLLLK